MQNVDELVEDILDREGGYSEDADDPGGPTKYGVTLATLRGLGIDTDANGQIDRDDVRQLARTDAARLIKAQYFQRPGIARLPEALHPTVLDMYVNAGSNAIRLLQVLLADFDESVTVDGAIGPQTAAASHRAQAKAPAHLVDAYGIARRNYYYDLADRRPQLRKFACARDGGKGGWIKRA